MKDKYAFMIYQEDLQKSYSVCMAAQHPRKATLERWYDSIGRASLHEREEYQKKSELLLLSTLLAHYPDIEIENLTGESPDFIISFRGRRIGVEVSEVINHCELKKKESYINRIFRTVERQLSQYKSLSGIYHLQIDYRDPDFYAQPQQLIREISQAITNNKKTKSIRNIRRTPHQKGVFLFLEYQFSLFDGLDEEKLLSLIEKKNSKYELYQGKTQECWLVLVSNMNNVGSRYSYINAGNALGKVDSPFDRIIHIENLHREMMVIK